MHSRSGPVPLPIDLFREVPEQPQPHFERGHLAERSVPRCMSSGISVRCNSSAGVLLREPSHPISWWPIFARGDSLARLVPNRVQATRQSHRRQLVMRALAP